jgi:hypothetical protein
MRGQGEPPGWEDRYSINREQWSENWLLYERDLLIQEDLEWLAEAVYQFYQVHLDKLIRENDRMWGDFCKKKYDEDWNELGLELSTWGYDMTDPWSWLLICTRMKPQRISVLVPILPTRSSQSLWTAGRT